MKTKGRLLMSGLIALCFAVSSTAQSSGKDLDQAKLLKQFTGKWKSDRGKDTTAFWEATPFGKGFITIGEYKANDETYASYRQLIGISPNNKEVIFYSMWKNGLIMTWYVGKYVSESKLIFEQLHIVKLGVVLAIGEVEHLAPVKFKFTYKWRGNNISWDDAIVSEHIYERIE